MTTGDPPGAAETDGHAAALAALGLSPGRLRRVLDGRSPRDAWRALATGTHPEDPDGRLRVALGRRPPAALAQRCAQAGVTLHVLGEAGYPGALAGDAEAPAVLFSQGAPGALGSHRVAVVGTRSASAVGREVAAEISHTLVRAGVTVVSALAEGIGSAALRGGAAATAPGPGAVQGGGTVAVLGTAHDAVAGAEQEQLRTMVAASGLVLSELPPGAPSARWRFGARQRIVAALADVVVVVECHDGEARGLVGSARRRRVPVAAVPGSVRCPASSDTNALLVAGGACVRDGADVLSLLAGCTEWKPGPAGGATRSRPRTSRRGADHGGGAMAPAVLAVLTDTPAGVDDIARRTGAPLGTVALCLEQLAAGGRARAEGGWWRLVPAER